MSVCTPVPLAQPAPVHPETLLCREARTFILKLILPGVEVRRSREHGGAWCPASGSLDLVF